MSDQGKTPSTISELLANRPFIVCVLYLCTYFTGVSCVVGVVLAYAFQSGQTEEWEENHYSYLIRTFWILIGAFVIALTGGIVIFALMETLIIATLFGLLFFGVLILTAVRTVYCMINAVRQKPMPRRRTLLL